MSKRVQQRRARRRRLSARVQRRLVKAPRPPGGGRGADPAVALAGRAYRRGQALAGGQRSDDVPALAMRLLAVADQEMRGVRQAVPPVRELACHRGCAWCCFLQVPVSAPEVLLLAAHLRRTRSPEELAALRRRVAELDDRTHGLDAKQRLAARLPCALLEGGACSVYPLRPLACRGWNSYDDRVCRRAVELGAEPTAHLYTPQTSVTGALLDGLLAGLASEGLQGERLELTAALRIALDAPDAAERWLAGEPLFAPARCAGPGRDA